VRPNLTAAEQRSALVGSAVDLGQEGPDNDYGFGRIDALAAYDSITNQPPPDTTPPSIDIVTPADGVTYSRGQAVNASYSCQDEAGGSGLASCQGTVTDGSAIDTATPGSKTFTVMATDNSGNEASVTSTYTVDECTTRGTLAGETLTGTAGDDVICGGGGGGDTIKGLGGNDILKGQGGADKLLGGTGQDLLDGGSGVDTASYSTSLTAITASLATNSATGEGSDAFVGIENLLGSPRADTLTGSDTDNTLTGGDGNDTEQGGAGPDTILGGGGADELFGGGGNDTVNSRDGINGNDSLAGGPGTDTRVTDAREKSIVGFP